MPSLPPGSMRGLPRLGGRLNGSSHGTDRRTNQEVYRHTARASGGPDSRASGAAAAGASPRFSASCYRARARASGFVQVTSIIIKSDDNPSTKALRHEGLRVGEILAYRAWRVIQSNWVRRRSDLLHSPFVEDYVWEPDAPACGDVRSYGIYSYRDRICSERDYRYRYTVRGPLLFGAVKIWGEIVEHRAGYRSQFAKIVSLDHGDPQLLEKFRKVYCLPPAREDGRTAPSISDHRMDAGGS